MSVIYPLLYQRAESAIRLVRAQAMVAGARASLLVLLAISAWASLPADALAQSPVVWTEPAANEYLADMPDEIRMRFSVPVDHPERSISLLDRHGSVVASGSGNIFTDGYELVIPLPGDLPEDVYTVQWSVQASADGARHSGLFAFAAGQAQAPLVSSPPEPQLDGSNGWLTPVARATSLFGTTAAVGMLLVWLTLVRPVLIAGNIDARSIGARVSRWIWAPFGIAVLGVVVGVYAELQRSGGSISDVTEILTASSDGSTWLLQIVHLALLGAALAIPGIWRRNRGWRMPVVVLIAAGSALLPMALSSHAGDQAAGQTAAAANQWLHLAGVSTWVGGSLLLGLVAVLAPDNWARITTRDFWLRTVFLGGLSAMVLAISGLYVFHLSTGNLAALRETSFGEILVLKIGLSVLFLLAGGALLVTRLRRKGVNPSAYSSGVAIAILLVIAIGILAQSGRLSAEDLSARDALIASEDRQQHEFVSGDLRGALSVTPGVAGHNRFTLDLSAPGAALSETAHTLVRLTPPSGLEGQRERLLFPQEICTADGDVIESPVSRYEGSGLDLSLAGQWDLEIVVQRLDGDNARIPLTIPIAPELAPSRAPGSPLRFSGIQATLAVLMAAGVLTLGGIALVDRWRGTRRSDITGMLAIVLLVFTVLALWNGRITHTPDAQARNPVPRTIESVEAGRNAYLEHCVVCHGADGKGRGEMAEDLSRPPADLTASHMDSHPVGDIAYWIQSGIDPAMPGFDQRMTDEEVWHLVNYLRSLRHPLDDG